MGKNRFDLVADNAGEPREEVVEGRAALEIPEERYDGYPRTFEGPGTADLLLVALDG